MTDELVKKLISELDTKITEIRPQLESIKEIYMLLEGIKKHTGASFDLPDLNWLIGKGEATQTPTLKQSEITIKAGMFYNKELTSAAEEYLKMVGHAVSFEEIYNALLEGHASIEGDAARDKFNTALTRATRKFKKFGTGFEASYGLLSWYEKKKRNRAEEILEKMEEIEGVEKKEEIEEKGE